MVVVFGALVPQVADIARLIEAEFRDMPGMRLTDAQIRRLWNLSGELCDVVLDQMCRAGQLMRDQTGQYVRPMGPRLTAGPKRYRMTSLHDERHDTRRRR